MFREETEFSCFHFFLKFMDYVDILTHENHSYKAVADIALITVKDFIN